jgi:hypothetical protein
MTMTIQYLLVAIIVACAVGYGVVTVLRKRRSFSTKAGCGADCGCEAKGSRKKTA